MRSRSSWRRVRVERGIYWLPNGKYAVLCRRAGRQWYRTVGSDLALARTAREVLIAAAAPASRRPRRACGSPPSPRGGLSASRPRSPPANATRARSRHTATC
jgi:hypothetical protein